MSVETDHLAGTIDLDTESAPLISKERLYKLWEDGNWSARTLDFTQDSRDWQAIDEEQRQSIRWVFAMFLDGEESVTVTLAPFMEALTSYEDRTYMATQIADEARHHVFFDRFIREVAGVGNDMTSALDQTRPSLSWGYRQIFTELDRVTTQLRLNPRSQTLLAQGIAIYHLTIEALLAHTGQHYLREYGRKNKLFPAFTEGINFTARDESRHIAFGVQTMRELIAANPACKTAAIQMFNRILPWFAGVFTPPRQDWDYLTRLGFVPEEIFTFGLRSFLNKIQRAGIDPSEVLALAKLGYPRGPAEMARHTMRLVRSNFIGTDAAPIVSESALDDLFQSVAWTADFTRQSIPVHATLQFRFPDAAPRVLMLTPDRQSDVRVGDVANPTLTLHTVAADWVRICAGRLSITQALLSRRLRINGNMNLALKLPRILPV